MPRKVVSKKAVSKPVANNWKCNPGWLLIGIIFATLGIFMVVNGFVNQFGGANASMVLPAYFIGIVLLAIAKHAKRKSCWGYCKPM